jgi:glycosyltransferase involved in cell wall biosynthesis
MHEHGWITVEIRIYKEEEAVSIKCGGLRSKGVIKNSIANKPLITVITVVYNGQKTVRQTIESVLNQTYDNIEYIVIDGGSTDDTLCIISEYENRIDYWVSEPDNGIYFAMNKAIKLSNGDYIGLLNSDDWYEPEACEIIAERINATNVDVYYGMENIYDRDMTLLLVVGYTIDFIWTKSILHQTCFISKNVYNHKLYNEKYKSAADFKFFVDIKESARFEFIPKVLCNARTGGMSSTKQGQKELLRIAYLNKKIGFLMYMLKRIWLMR